ncbi:hypothetical protein [Nocardioides convexus]|nr:hypothetical protein [Nocardioides convexus]
MGRRRRWRDPGLLRFGSLVRQADSESPVFPSTALHVAAALDRALA